MIEAYYNEHDEFKADWLRELIRRNLIMPGDVDTRSIRDVQAADLEPYTQVHLFAGIAVWSYALRMAGWPDSRPVWTGSCPCQPFSVAGKQKGKKDDRHLWPEMLRLIQQSERPPHVIIGEQVSGKNGRAWFDDVASGLGDVDYTVGAIDSPACSVGAPQIRNRLYWVAVADSLSIRVLRRDNEHSPGEDSLQGDQRERIRVDASTSGNVYGLAVSKDYRCAREQDEPGQTGRHSAAHGGNDGGLAVADSQRRAGEQVRVLARESRDAGVEARGSSGFGGLAGSDGGHAGQAGPVNGFWSGSRWVLTRPQRVGDRPGLRPTKPSIFPLVNGIAGRVGLLRGAGDAIVSTQAQAWIETIIETLAEGHEF